MQREFWRWTKRFAKYGLTLHTEKTRLIAFGLTVLIKSEKEGKGKPVTFDFLGFTHICKRSRRGKFAIHVRTMPMPPLLGEHRLAPG